MAERDGVIPFPDVAHDTQRAPRFAVSFCDDVVEQDGFCAPLFEVDVGFFRAFVG